MSNAYSRSCVCAKPVLLAGVNICDNCGFPRPQSDFDTAADPAQSAPSAEPNLAELVKKCEGITLKVNPEGLERIAKETALAHANAWYEDTPCPCDRPLEHHQSQDCKVQKIAAYAALRTAQLERELSEYRAGVVSMGENMTDLAGKLSNAETRAETAESALRDAVKFEIGTIQGQPVYVELSARDWHFATGSGKVEHPSVSLWAVRLVGNCLTKSGDWIYEPLPSSRDEQFISDARWDSYESAKEAAKNALTVAAQTPEEK